MLAFAGTTAGLVAASAKTPKPLAALAKKADLWVAPPTVDADERWFPDEIAPLADAVAAALAQPELGGHRVIPPDEVRALYAGVKEGKLPGVTAACAAPPPPEALARLVYGGVGIASVHVQCVPPGCTLTVIVSSPRPTPKSPTNLEPTAYFSMPVPRGEPPNRWAERVRAGGLSRAKPDETEIANLPNIGRMPDDSSARQASVRVEISDVRRSGKWPSRLSASTFATVAPALDACIKPRAPWRTTPYYTIEVDAQGAVRRCEVEQAEDVPRGEPPCVCGVFRDLHLEPGAAPRRASFALTLSRTDRGADDRVERSGYFVPDHATDPSAALATTAIDENALVACLSSIRAAAPYPPVPVRLSVGADGKVTSHDIKWPPKIPTAVAECLEGAISQGQFNCPLSGESAIDGKLFVDVRRARRH